MKTIRQKKNTLPPPHHHRFSSHLPRQSKADAKDCKKIRLESLFKSYRSNEIVRLVCKGNLSLEIEKQLQKFMTTGHKKVYRDNVYIQPGTSQALAQSLAEQLLHPSTTFLFSARLYPQEEVRQFRTSNSDSKNSFLSRTSTQKELRPFLPSKKTTFKPTFQPKTMSAIPPQEDKDLVSKRCLSQRNIAHEWSGQKKHDEMFTVEELKESMQSEPRESFKNGKDKENMGYRANEEYIERPKFFMETLGPVSFAQQPEPQEKIEQLITTELLSPLQTCPLPEIKELIIKKSLKQAIENPPEIKVSAPTEPGFSLTSQLRKGLIQGGVSASQSLNFKIAGDQSIEDQKLRKQESHIEELSSIASNPREDPFRKETEQKQLDSIKGEIQDINHCFAKKPEGQVQRVNLGALGQQREAGAQECVQISENTKDHPMQVRYNVRFLSNRNKGTEVVRLSPLRFRKKEEMVQQLVKARLVSKESDSIFIP